MTDTNDTIQKIADGLDGLAAVIRKYGTCAPAALDELASRLRALSARASAGEGGEYVLVPRRLTAENGAKGLLSGEFAESVMINCPECESGTIDGAEHCEVCSGKGQYRQQVPVEWTTIKEIHRAVVDLFTATQQPVPQCRWPDCGYDGNAVMGGSHCGPNCHAAPQPAQTQGEEYALYCELCPTAFHGDEELASNSGWTQNWDGWTCPAHKATPQPAAAQGGRAFQPGDRIEWQGMNGTWFPGKIVAVRDRVTTYDAKLDDGCDAKDFAAGRFRMLAAAPQPQEAPAQECKHKWRNSDRADPMLPCAWVQQCTKCGAYEDDN